MSPWWQERSKPSAPGPLGGCGPLLTWQPLPPRGSDCPSEAELFPEPTCSSRRPVCVEGGQRWAGSLWCSDNKGALPTGGLVLCGCGYGGPGSPGHTDPQVLLQQAILEGPHPVTVSGCEDGRPGQCDTCQAVTMGSHSYSRGGSESSGSMRRDPGGKGGLQGSAGVS